MLKNLAAEEAQGKSLVDKALKQDVKHFVYTSVDRGGDETSWISPTDVPHFRTKHNIELHLREEAARAGGGMTWTILRPVAFMDNFAPGAFGGKVFLAALRRELGEEKRLQLVSCRDIGVFGVKALMGAGSKEWGNQAIGLVGDSLSMEEMVKVFGEETENPVTPTWGVLGSAFMWGVGEMGNMVRWFGRVGYDADLERCQRLHPEMMDLRRWLREESKFELKK